VNPRKILGVDLPKIAVGELANLVLFNPKATWIFDSSSNRSRSANSPLMKQKLTGKVVWACNKGQSFRSNY
jgi:dihydroorotase